MGEKTKVRYLITGVGGFIGKHLYNRLVQTKNPDDIIVGIDRRSPYTFENHPDGTSDHFICNCQLDNDMWVNRLISSYKPDVIMHFAGCATVSSPPDKIWKSNVNTTFNLVNAISQVYKKPPKFILASSINAERNESPYAASKIAAEAIVNAYNYQEYIIGMPLRFCAVAGAYNTHGVVKDIVRKIMTQDNPEAFGNWPGSQKPFLFIDQLVDIIIDITEHLNSANCLRHNSLTICPSDTITVSEIIRIVSEITKINKKFSFNGTTWKGDVNYVAPSYENKYLNRYSKFKPESSYKAIEKSVKQILGEEYSEYWNSL